MAKKKRQRSATSKPARRTMTPGQRERAVREIYDRIPLEHLRCKGYCHDSCGPVGYSEAEAKVIAYRHGSSPMINAFHKGRMERPDDISCDKLTHDKRCSIYEDRPAICRLYGLFRKLECAHGCVPDEWMDESEVVDIFSLLDELEGPHRPSMQMAMVVSLVSKVQNNKPVLTPIDEWMSGDTVIERWRM